MRKPPNISIEDLKAAARTTHFGRRKHKGIARKGPLYNWVKTLIDSGCFSLAQSLVWIADQQPPLRKPMGSYKPPTPRNQSRQSW
jgi:hypothetical protein